MVKPKIGIVGGCGSLATAHIFSELMKYIVNNYKVESDNDYPYLVIINCPDDNMNEKGFSENDNILTKHILELQSIGCTHIYIACNTYHLLFHKLNTYLRPETKLINLVELIGSKTYNGNIGILCSEVSAETRLHERYIDLSVKRVFYPNRQKQNIVNLIIEAAISGNLNSSTFFSLIECFKTEKNLDHIIIGCTELSLFRDPILRKSFNIIDCCEVLVEHIAKTSRGELIENL